MKYMKKTLIIVAIVLGLCSCTSSDVGSFNIIGLWGLVSETITDGNGKTDRFDPLESGAFYEYFEFKADGTLVRTTVYNNKTVLGIYTYNDATRALSYKFDGNKYYFPAVVNVISAKEMNITTDGGSVGRMTQYFVKVKKIK